MGSGEGGRATSGRCGNWVLKNEGHGVRPSRNFGKGSFRDRSLRPQETWQRHRRKKERGERKRASPQESTAPSGEEKLDAGPCPGRSPAQPPCVHPQLAVGQAPEAPAPLAGALRAGGA